MNRLPERWRPPELKPDEIGDPVRMMEILAEIQAHAREELAAMPAILRETMEKLSQEMSRKLMGVPEWQIHDVFDREFPKLLKRFDRQVVEFLTREWGKRT